MVLLSLLLQTILIVFGPRRKTNARSWIRILVWSAYLSADMVATVALGNLARSQGDLSGDVLEKANNSIQAFWAPFLLCTLVAPTQSLHTRLKITSLWLRHLLGLVVQVKIDKHAYSTTDITITYLLFVAAVFLEFYAFLCLVLSDWTMIWLIDKGGNGLTIVTYSLIRKLTRSERWSRSISQYNLISSSIESEPPKCLGLLGIDEMMRQMHVNRKDLNVGLQGLIFSNIFE
uniref:DUF4220 domain-containing protein n=1 Tax=Populus alba TaxID=43335 RepID=A0A4U5P2B7_POPAL|nr:hypothetical protein D5086_0000234880 [Populus alba]